VLIELIKDFRIEDIGAAIRLVEMQPGDVVAVGFDMKMCGCSDLGQE
jgi:hypothetical protein